MKPATRDKQEMIRIYSGHLFFNIFTFYKEMQQNVIRKQYALVKEIE
jgi:hypothetical protein